MLAIVLPGGFERAAIPARFDRRGAGP